MSFSTLTRCQLVVFSAELSDGGLGGLAVDLAERTRELLSEVGWEATLSTPGEPLQPNPVLLLIVTGGTEHQILEVVARTSHPAILLVHRANNSLPAALEILACLQQQGRRGIIVSIDGDEQSRQQFRCTLAAVAARHRLQSARFGILGGASPWLVASSPDPQAVSSRIGCELIAIEQQELLDIMGRVNGPEVAELSREVLAQVEPGAPAVAAPHAAVKIYLGLRQLVVKYRLDGVTVRCFDLIKPTSTTGCLALALLSDEGVVAGCEGDLPALLTMYLLSSLSGQATFMANPQEISLADRTVWLAHCTVARSLCRSFHLDSHFETGIGVAVAGAIAAGPVTVARLGGPECCQLWMAEGQVVATASAPDRCRTQVLVKFDQDLGDLLRRPLGNHLVLTPGHWAATLQAFEELGDS